MTFDYSEPLRLKNQTDRQSGVMEEFKGWS